MEIDDREFGDDTKFRGNQGRDGWRDEENEYHQGAHYEAFDTRYSGGRGIKVLVA